MKQRVLAGLGAIVLIAAALVLRSQLGDDGGSEATRPNGTTGTPVVACTPDLQDICDALVDADLIEATAPLDLDAQKKGGPTAAAPPDDIDAWITWDSIPAVANFEAQDERGPEPWGEAEVLGSSSLAVLATPTTAEAFRAACAPIDWACLADQAAENLAVGTPTTADGLTRIAPLARALDVENVNEVDALTLGEIIGQPNAQPSAAAAGTTLLTKPGEFGAVVGLRPLLDVFRQKQSGQKMQLIDVTPATAATVVLVPRQGVDLGKLAKKVTADDTAAAALTTIGVEVGQGELAPEDLAGFLFQVREKVG